DEFLNLWLAGFKSFQKININAESHITWKLSEDIVAFHIVVSGRVQGVFFRASLQRVADSIGMVGWVRNLGNGDVEALIQGRKSDVDKVIEWSSTGPKRAIVLNVPINKVEPQPDLRNFNILF
ncbi:MAG: acylphosphatase, partial [Rhabdochlamydiaceae bacterium]